MSEPTASPHPAALPTESEARTEVDATVEPGDTAGGQDVTEAPVSAETTGSEAIGSQPTPPVETESTPVEPESTPVEPDPTPVETESTPSEPDPTPARLERTPVEPVPASDPEPAPGLELTAGHDTTGTAHDGIPADRADAPALAPGPAPTPARPTRVPSPSALARPAAPSPASIRPATAAPGVRASQFGRVADDGTVFVSTPEGEKEVGSFPGATPEEALAYFTRKYDEVDAQADLLLQRVTQTDLSAKEATDGLAKLREAAKDLRAVGDLVALATKVESVATAVEARRQVDAAERAQAREAARARRTQIVEAAERIAAQPEEKIQWKASSTQMRQLLEDWKSAQREGPKLDRETEQTLWHRLSGARNSFDKMRRVHFAQLGSAQSEAKATKEELVAEAERLAQSREWGPTAGAFKRLMDRWRQAGRASRTDDDALWQRFKAAQDSFFAAKDEVVAAENEEFTDNLKVKEQLLAQAQALLPVKDLDATKAALRQIQDKWDAAGKVPRSDLERIEKGMRRVETAVRDAEDRKWARSNPEVVARAQSLVTQLEAACEGLRADLAKAEAGGNATKIAKAREALQARESWLEQARSGLEEFSG